MNLFLPTDLPNQRLPLRRIIKTWWPLAASWILMSAEVPAVSAVIARLANPEIHLAAWGGVVYPVSLIVESPVIMLLAASTALSKDWDSYTKLRRFMMATGAVMTLLHILVAFTPLYYPVVGGLLGVPAEVVEPARLGLMIMLPWTWAIAYRRFNQGVLIRFGRADAIGIGTVVRLVADGLVLAAGYTASRLGVSLPGISVGAAAVATGVLCEAAYVGIIVRPVLNWKLRLAPPPTKPLTLPGFLTFYIPLALTSLISLLANPIGSAALSRMPVALDSLAVWPVVTGLISMVRSLGTAYNEVVVALLEEPGSSPSLRRFTGLLSAAATALLFLAAATPFSGLWFLRVSALPPQLARLATTGLWIAIPLPALSVLQSWYQGTILHGRRTRGITESVIIYLASSAVFLWVGVTWGGTVGLYIGLASQVVSTCIQTAWLWLRSRSAMRLVDERDQTILAGLVD
ncbi:MAG TPA: hypothetical protein VF823_09625 [Anaerolineales bacterium]